MTIKTCGYKNQHPDFSKYKDENTPNHLKNIMLKVMLNNLSLISNYIGTWKDLEYAISDYDQNEFIESFDISYSINTSGRLGKAIMLYHSKVVNKCHYYGIERLPLEMITKNHKTT